MHGEFYVSCVFLVLLWVLCFYTVFLVFAEFCACVHLLWSLFLHSCVWLQSKHKTLRTHMQIKNLTHQTQETKQTYTNSADTRNTANTESSLNTKHHSGTRLFLLITNLRVLFISAMYPGLKYIIKPCSYVTYSAYMLLIHIRLMFSLTCIPLC